MSVSLVELALQDPNEHYVTRVQANDSGDACSHVVVQAFCTTDTHARARTQTHTHTHTHTHTQLLLLSGFRVIDAWDTRTHTHTHTHKHKHNTNITHTCTHTHTRTNA
jgi:hypothetical protein